MSQIIDTLREQDEDAANALEIMALEYMRRRHKDGSTVADDDKLDKGALSRASSEYAYWVAASETQPGKYRWNISSTTGVPTEWPFPPEEWKPKTPRFALIQAGVYALAELTRMIRSSK